jgi:hypothetical protein
MNMYRVFPILALAFMSVRARGETIDDAITPPEQISVAEVAGYKKEWERQNFSHELFDAVLQRFVNTAGEVDYAGLRADPAQLDEYIFRLQRTPPHGFPTEDARLAYWVNAYNAFTMKAVLSLLPADREKWKTFRLKQCKPDLWATTKFLAGGHQFTLNQIEQNLRGAKDARIHAALNCGSRGCPRLQRSAFGAEKLNDQLDAAASAWVNDPERNALKDLTLTISPVFNWYEDDFGKDAASFIARYTKDAALKEKLRSGSISIRFDAFKWSLNAQARQETPAAAEKP